ncbi:hypothetical protein ACFWJ4_23635 [Kitasatospora sp. NPDC127067]|uniref:hypothetical protein n=1 Tax=Kitasatospora sp. NPDC127067 TaxID=3347126 RepID=UPI0036582D08
MELSMDSARLGSNRFNGRISDLMSRNATKWAALLMLIASYLAVLVVVFPASSDNDELVDDLRSRRASVVNLDTNGSEVFVEWSTGILSRKKETYKFTYGNPGPAGAIDAFERAIEQEVSSSGATVQFQAFDPSHGFGGLKLLISVAYPSLLGWSPLGVGAYLIGLLTIGHILLGVRRSTQRYWAWFWICLLTGFGFFAYLWAEPRPLLAISAKRRKSGPDRSPGVLGVLGYTAFTMAFLAVLGIAFVQTIHAI